VGRLKGRRVSLGPPTTSVHFLARDVLAFAGLRARAGAIAPHRELSVKRGL
jgi:TRAP-type uncharacterized transport system substrate-binding protein